MRMQSNLAQSHNANPAQAPRYAQMSALPSLPDFIGWTHPIHRDVVKKKIRYAVVGLGHIAQTAVLPAFKHAENSELPALSAAVQP